MRSDHDSSGNKTLVVGKQTPPQGWMSGHVHIYPVRVYYEDTDVGGVVYHANYLKFAERARTEMLRLMGFPHSALMKHEGRAFAVRHCEADFIKPALFDDSLEIHTSNTDLEAASFWIDQRVKREGHDLAVLRVRLACIAQNGKPVRLPAQLRSALSALKLESCEQGQNDDCHQNDDIVENILITERV